MATTPMTKIDRTLWLNVSEFAKLQGKKPVTIYAWIYDGFIAELGLIIRKDVTGRIKIGVPYAHSFYSEMISH
jgi:hypothetical protein